MSLTYASVCSGIEAASVAWHPLGWRGIFTAEIEAFPSAVLAHHWPGIPNYGDMTAYEKWNQHQPDVLVGGTPCQAFSVAGLRKGLADPRGNLTLTYLAVVAKYRPRWVVWENVPGVLSDKSGAFGAFLGGLGELGYGFAYRILDAQFFGVAQRRRRVFVVAHAGGLWQRAAAVLFERESLRGDPAPSRAPREAVAGSLRSGAAGGRSHGKLNGSDEMPLVTAPTLPARTKGGGGLGTDFDCAGGRISTAPGEGFPNASEGLPEVCGALSDGAHNGGGSTGRMPTRGGSLPFRMTAFGEYVDDATASAIKQRDFKDATDLIATHQGGSFDAEAIAFPQNMSATQCASAEEVCPNLQADNPTAVAFKPSHFTRDKDGAPSETFPPLSADADKGDQDPVIFQPRIARNGRGQPEEVCPALNGSDAGATSDMRPVVAYTIQSNDGGSHKRKDRPEGGLYVKETDTALTVGSTDTTAIATFQQSSQAGRGTIGYDAGGLAKPVKTQMDGQMLHAASAVRRLTPRECERLQGFPDDYTAIPTRTARKLERDTMIWLRLTRPNLSDEECARIAADGPRYKALGNSMAVPVMAWIGRRIAEVEGILGAEDEFPKINDGSGLTSPLPVT